MTLSAKREYMSRMRTIYQITHKRKEKGRLIRQVSETIPCHRKHAIRLLSKKSADRGLSSCRLSKYPDYLIRILEEIWIATQRPWSVRLKSAIKLWLPHIVDKWQLNPGDTALLLSMSPATMDRRLARYKTHLKRRVYGKTRPGRWLRQATPIQTESWNVPEPGWLEADTVSHSGPSYYGTFAYSFNQVDLFSGWVECAAILGKSADKIVAAAEEMRLAMPFQQKGIDTDNGDEFLNWPMARYCEGKGILRFRSRPYKKDDQAHIEQKNGTHVRQLIGWDRYDTEEAVAVMHDLYRNEWRLMSNLFLPSVKLKNKIRIGSRTKRVYEEAKTPLDRLREAGLGDRAKIEALYRIRQTINPFELADIVERKLNNIWRLATRVRPSREPEPMRIKPNWSLETGDYPPVCVPRISQDVAKIRIGYRREKMLGTF
jgi:transposase InsO family protein